MRQIFSSKNCANKETHSSGDMYAIRILYKGNNYFSPAILWLALVPLVTLISPCHKNWMPDLKARNINIPTKTLLRLLRNFSKLSTFSQH